MKYGLLVNERNSNIGDDIQAYAVSQFLPRVDLIIDREQMDLPHGDPKEPIALVTSAWFMWKRHNWPPHRQIVPLLCSYHHYDRRKDPMDDKVYSVPAFRERYEGVGGQWMRDWGPVGCRDAHTLEAMQEMGIPCYFSGCATLTLPNMPETPDRGSYVVFVDVNKDVEKKLRRIIGKRFEIRKETHETPVIAGAPWTERAKRVEKYLTLYQNARYVVTRRLHVALPCLAMGVPVLVVQNPKTMNDPNRFKPYDEWTHYCTNEEFMKNGAPFFDLEGGTTKNKDVYLPYREKLIEKFKDFAARCEANAGKGLSFFSRISYTEEEEMRWRISYMRGILERVHKEVRTMHSELYARRKAELKEQKQAAKKAKAEAKDAKATKAKAAAFGIPPADADAAAVQNLPEASCAAESAGAKAAPAESVMDDLRRFGEMRLLVKKFETLVLESEMKMLNRLA